MSELKHQIEAILFAAARTVSLEELCRLCKTRDPVAVQQAVDTLKQELKARDSPLLITSEADGWKMTVGEKHLATVREITPHTELSKALLETLAVIAWKQPILQAEVIKIRTSGAYEHVAELLKLGFINKTRQGRSYALKVTGKFFEYFDLPGHEALKAEFEKIQGMPEMQQIIGNQANLGELKVYHVPPEQQAQPTPTEPNQGLGKLEVVDVPEEPEWQRPAPAERADEPMEDDLKQVLTSAMEGIPEPEQSAPEPEEQEAKQSDEEPGEGEEAQEESESPEEQESSRKLPAALDAFANEGKAEWGKEKKKPADEDEDAEESEDEKSGLDEKL